MAANLCLNRLAASHEPSLSLDDERDDPQAAAKLRPIDLAGLFGLHPNPAPGLPAWQAGHLVPMHAFGAPNESRSHFRATELMERGVDDERGPASGWIGRHLATRNTGNQSPLRAGPRPVAAAQPERGRIRGRLALHR